MDNLQSEEIVQVELVEVVMNEIKAWLITTYQSINQSKKSLPSRMCESKTVNQTVKFTIQARFCVHFCLNIKPRVSSSI